MDVTNELKYGRQVSINKLHLQAKVQLFYLKPFSGEKIAIIQKNFHKNLLLFFKNKTLM